MPAYVRPPVEIATFVDASGAPIPYGERWELSPPDETYSMCTHPERFAAVVEVARALIDHLVTTYDVDRTGDVDRPTLTPRTGGGASLTWELRDDEPGVAMRAGHRFDGLWPTCSCDACDDDVLVLIEDLEDTVLTIVEGGMSEWRSGPVTSMPLVTDDAGNAIGDEVVPWQSHVRFTGRLSTEQSGWGADAPEPVELPTEPVPWPPWPVRPPRA